MLYFRKSVQETAVSAGGVAFDALLAALLGTILEGGLLGRLLGGLLLCWLGRHRPTR